MRLLPTETLPPREPIERCHEPAPTEAQVGYRLFAPCLRWEFGFTCPLCLLHEADLTGGYSIEKTGQSTVEHLRVKSVHPEGTNEYENLVLACRFCNTARGDKPHVREDGSRLLNPRKEAWSQHFELEKHHLVPRTTDGESTKEAYKINDDSRTDRREGRAKALTDCHDILRGIHAKQRRLERLVAEGSEAAREHLRDLVKSKRLATRIALRHRWIPEKAPSVCRCDHTDHHDIPTCYRDQVVELDLEAS